MRIKHVDIAKGISITLVAMFHSKMWLIIPDFIASLSLLRMPLFFFMSGVFFSYSQDLNTFVKKKAEALLKPYFFVSLMVVLITALFFDGHFWRGVFGVFFGTGDSMPWVPLWFLTHLFAVYLFSFALLKYTYFGKASSIFQWFFLILLFCVGIKFVNAFWYLKLHLFGENYVMPGLPFSVDVILTTSFFFMAGYLLRHYIKGFTPHAGMMLVAILIYYAVVHFTKAYVNFNGRDYAVPVWATLGAVTGIYTVLCIACYVSVFESVTNFFSMLGRNSLYILIFHDFINRTLFLWVKSYIDADIVLKVAAVFCFLAALLLPLLIKRVILSTPLLSIFFVPVKDHKLGKVIFSGFRKV